MPHVAPNRFLISCVGTALLGVLGACSPKKTHEIHPFTNMPFSHNYPVGEDGSGGGKIPQHQRD